MIKHDVRTIKRDNHTIWNALLGELVGLRWWRTAPELQDTPVAYWLRRESPDQYPEELTIPVSSFEAWDNQDLWRLKFLPLDNMWATFEVIRAFTEGLPYPNAFTLDRVGDRQWKATFRLQGTDFVAIDSTLERAISFAALASCGYGSAPETDSLQSV